MTSPDRFTAATALLLVEARDGDSNVVGSLPSDGSGPESALSVTQAGSMRDVRSLLSTGAFDVILLDLTLPDSSGLETLRTLLELEPGAPVIVLTGPGEEEVGAATLQMGAHDVLEKSRFDRAALFRSVRHARERFELMRAVAERTGELERSEMRSQQIIERAADAIVVLDLTGRVLFCNPAARELFEWGDDDANLALDLPLTHATAEMKIMCSDGSRTAADVRLVDIDWCGEPAHLATLRDITQHKNLLLELDSTRRRELRLRDEFLSHVSHELRTPLTVIQQYVSLMLDGLVGEFSRDQLKYLGTVLRNGQQLGKMIEDLLEVTRSDTGKLTVSTDEVEVAPVVAEAMAMARSLARDGDLRIELDLQPELPPVLADASRVRQVLVNLLGNAVKYGGDDVTISITVRRDPDTPHVLRFTVQDDGPGIPPANLDHVFEHFYQVDFVSREGRKGLGLGLYLSRQLVEQHGGRIWAENRPNVGATLSFTLPVFAMDRIVSPLAAADAARRHLHLVAVVLGGAGGGPLREFQYKYVEALQDLIGSCVLADRDLVLPSNVVPPGLGVVTVLAGADAQGVAALVGRIRSQFAAALGFRGKNLTLRHLSAEIAAPADHGLAQAAWSREVAAGVIEAQAGLLERLTHLQGRSEKQVRPDIAETPSAETGRP